MKKTVSILLIVIIGFLIGCAETATLQQKGISIYIENGGALTLGMKREDAEKVMDTCGFEQHEPSDCIDQYFMYKDVRGVCYQLKGSEYRVNEGNGFTYRVENGYLFHYTETSKGDILTGIEVRSSNIKTENGFHAQAEIESGIIPKMFGKYSDSRYYGAELTNLYIYDREEYVLTFVEIGDDPKYRTTVDSDFWSIELTEYYLEPAPSNDGHLGD